MKRDHIGRGPILGRGGPYYLPSPEERRLPRKNKRDPQDVYRKNYASFGYTPRFSADSQVDDWIEERDKIPILLAVTLSSQEGPVPEKHGFVLIPELTSLRVAVWVNPIEKIGVLGCRGTGVFKKGFVQDLRDDAVIAGILGRQNTCQLEILKEAVPRMEYLLQLGLNEIIAAGHSLGGTASLCLAMKYPQIRAISLFGGGAATNPITVGPGAARATHYHILGDLISSHVASSAAKVVRIQKIGYDDWGYPYPHLVERIFKNDARRWKYISANEEQESWIRFGNSSYGLTTLSRKIRQIVCEKPIPGSTIKCPPKSFVQSSVEKLGGEFADYSADLTKDVAVGLVRKFI